MEEQVLITRHPGYASSARHWARILERLFPLPRLGAFPELTLLPSADEVAVIDRFIVRALRLAESEGLNGASGVRNSISREGDWKVDSNFPNDEALAGLAAHFRQLYSKDSSERASFYAVMRILRRLSEDGSEEETERLEMLKVWSRALGALRSKGARRLADEKLGAVRTSEPVDQSPEALIGMFVNGEYLHWDASHASNIAARTALPQFEANLRYRYHEAVAPIAYFFICFAHFADDLMKRSMAKSAA
jgi:hypothetical protein